MSKESDLPQGMTKGGALTVATSNRAAKATAVAVRNTDAPILVCLQDPFEGIAKSSTRIVHSTVRASDTDPTHLWRLESVLEMNPNRFFESWATRGSFLLDINVRASASAQAGAWAGTVATFSEAGSCRVGVMRGLDNSIHFSLESGSRHATEKAMPAPDALRFLNADVSFQVNGATGITFAASSVISKKSWSRLIGGSTAATKGLAFDGNWRLNLEERDGDCLALGQWAFALMSESDYSVLCRNNNWTENILS